MASVLDIDMGNTRLKWRISNYEPQAHGVADYQQSPLISLDELPVQPQRVRISCVAGNQKRELIAATCKNNWQLEAEFATVQDECGGVRQGYVDKSRLGVDRWLGLLAMKQQIGGGVLVSCGSAVTVDLLLPSGQHLGGYIVPGIGMMHRSLFSGTDAVKVEVARELSDLEPGRDTIEAVNKGVVAMVIGLVEQGADLYRTESGEVPQILITGGDGEIIQRFLPSNSIYNPYLVLDGLAVALP